MSELMRPIPFGHLIEWALEEYKKQGSIYGIREDKFYKNESNTYIETLGEKLATPVGPAAGPHSQLAQNIIAAYLTGSRFFEVKTVQILDGEDLRKCIARPCINAEDECYNVEWSTEFTVQEAYEEYVKAWFALHVLGKELGISETRDFAFNMSVGYDLAGIQSEKVNTYIDQMIDASGSKVWETCKTYLTNNIDKFNRLTLADVEAVSPAVSPSITLSTLHGCPSDEIERIATYLLTEKNIHTFIKCNPTLLGYECARQLLDDMGYDYITFDDHHFKEDLQFDQAVAMLKRLKAIAEERQLSVGVKITNTFPVQIKRHELPGEEMYMSGRSLYPLSINVASRLAEAFDGKLQISYSGGADFHNIDKIYATGIQPITIATTLLKPGGYERTQQIVNKIEAMKKENFTGIDVAQLKQLAANVTKDENHLKEAREVGSLKTTSNLNLFDCFMAPCKDGGCPISQQIPEYMKLYSEGKFDEAFKVIAIDNALPSITGTICDHQCQSKCTRVDYDRSVAIRQTKCNIADEAQANYIAQMVPAPLQTNKKVAVIGAGPAGVAVAYFLRRNGVEVTVLEKQDRPMGIVAKVIPDFRIAEAAIQRDYEMAVKAGVEFVYNVKEDYSINMLKQDYDYVVVATGAWKEGISPVKEGKTFIQDALAFLQTSKANNCQLELGKQVAVIGAGDVAMDCARAAKRAPGVESVQIVYRRTKEFMPAQPEEIRLALEDGVEIVELLSPVSYDGKTLVCEVQELTEQRDASGRKTIKGTGVLKSLDFDTVIGAVGARVDDTLFRANGIKLDHYNSPVVSSNNESSLKNVYIAGDCKAGASTIVKAIADAKVITKAILADAGLAHDFVRVDLPSAEKALYAKKGVLQCQGEEAQCLKCDQICEVCNDVCPNRANVKIIVNAKEFKNAHQIIHIDGMCNECGNCGVFCPHAGNPYKDKVTVFWTEHDFEDSTNVGFLAVGENQFKVRNEKGQIIEHTLGDGKISAELSIILETILRDYSYYFLEA